MTTSRGLSRAAVELARARARVPNLPVSRDGFASIALDSGVVKGKAGKTNMFTVAGGSLRPIGYAWRVRTKYADGTWSNWSTPAALSYATPPAPKTQGATVFEP